MMAISDQHRAVSDEDQPPGMRTVALSLLLGLVLLFSLGAVGGALYALIDGQADRPAAVLAVVAGALLLSVLCGWGLLRLKPWGAEGPMSDKTRKARNMMLVSGLLGAVIGAALSIASISTDRPLAAFSNAPLPPALVIPILAVWLLLVPLVSLQWHRNVDEHEAGAYRFGGLAGLYLYAFAAPAWWLAWRGGLAPEPDSMIIYAAVLFVWLVGWMWRRHR